MMLQLAFMALEMKAFSCFIRLHFGFAFKKSIYTLLLFDTPVFE